MTVKANSHFIDSDITGTSGLDDWQSFNFEFPPSDPAKIGISTAAELQLVGSGGDFPATGDYELANDIDLSSIDNFVPISLTTGGSFDGRYFTISNLSENLTAPDSYNMGLFNTLSGTSLVKRVILTDVAIVKNRNVSISIGLMVGVISTSATIEDCYVQGTITSTTVANLGDVGGFVGQVLSGSDTIIKRCGVEVVVTAGDDRRFVDVGGFVGEISGEITFENCYAIGTLQAPTDYVGGGGPDSRQVGGFVGSNFWLSTGNKATITNSYCAITIICTEGATPSSLGGFIGAYSGASDEDRELDSCFWDNDITPHSGIRDRSIDLVDCGELASNHSVEGNITEITKSTTTLMQTKSTFTDENWDFEDVWAINEGEYPRHIWKDGAPFKIQTGRQERTTAMPTNHAHLNGQTIQCLGDGSFLGTDVVAAGEVTIDDATTVNHVGLQYTSTILPMKLDGEVHIKRVSKIVPNVFESVGGDYGRDLTDLDSMVLRDANDPLDTDSALFSGTVELPFDGVLDRSGDIYITQNEPLPMNLLGIGIYLSQENI